MGAQDLVTVANTFIDAFSSADWQRFRGMLADDVVYEEAGTQRRSALSRAPGRSLTSHPAHALTAPCRTGAQRRA